MLINRFVTLSKRRDLNVSDVGNDRFTISELCVRYHSIPFYKHPSFNDNPLILGGVARAANSRTVNIHS